MYQYGKPGDQWGSIQEARHIVEFHFLESGIPQSR